MKFKNATELFRYEVDKKTGLFKKRYLLIIYDKGIIIKSPIDSGIIYKHDIHNIYFREEVLRDTKNKWTTMINYIDEDGVLCYFKLDDSDYDNLSTKLRKFDTDAYYKFNKKPISETIQWFTLACDLFYQSSGRDRNLFGGFIPNEYAKNCCEFCLDEYWGITNGEEGIEMIESLISGRSNNNFFSKKEELDIFTEINSNCGEQKIMAWDLARAIQISMDIYLAGYFSYEKAYNYCLRAAKKLQSLFNNWEDMHKSYVLGYSWWSGESINDPKSETSRRWQVCQDFKNHDESPYNLNWNLPLQPLGIAEK